MLEKAEFQTIHPVSRLLQCLLSHCRRQDDEFVISAVKRCAPIFDCLIQNTEVHRFKVKLLCEAQRLCHLMGLPRLSPESALLEVFFDGLYRAEVVEEKYFELWAIGSDDTPGKSKAMFQVSHFLDWLREAKIEGETSDEGEDGDEEKDGDSSDEEEDDLADLD